jgi:replication factor C subunit 1
MRQLGDVQIRMRLKVSGDKNEIRQSYIPALFPHIVKPLVDEGAVRAVAFLFGIFSLTGL